MRKNDFGKIEKKNNICINVFCYEGGSVFPKYISDQKFEKSMDLLFLTDRDKCHYVYIKDFDRYMFHKTKNKNKKWFCRSCLQCFSNKNLLTNHKENCLSINGAQSVKLEKWIIEFKNYCKQIHCPFKIYCDSACNLEGVEIYEMFYSKKYHNHISCSSVYKVVCSRLLFLEVKTLLMNLLQEFLKSMNTVRK